MLTLRAPAKINLFLKVAPPRPDGFHPLSSWFVTVGLFDTLELDVSPTPGIHFTCSDPGIPTDETNLVVRAARKLLPEGAGVRIHLTKTIPAGGGLGGGSSDAAWTLIGLRRLFNVKTDLDPLAASLGSDLNFFLHGPSAICTGRGEVVSPTFPPAARAALLLLPEIALSTPEVFRRFDARADGSGLTPTFFTELRAIDLLHRLSNDLEPAAFELAPALAEQREGAERTLGRPVRMSGSGSTLFTLFDTLAEAQAAATSTRLPVRVAVVEVCP